METPKKPVKKKVVSKSPGAKKSADESENHPVKKRIIDEDDDEEYDMPLDEIGGGYEGFEGYDEDDDY
jgi:hypothetical protein